MHAVFGFIIKMLPFAAVCLPVYGLVRGLFLYGTHRKINGYREAAMCLFVLFAAGLASQTLLPPLVWSADGLSFATGSHHETWLIPLRVLCYTYEDVFVRHSTYSLLINLLGNILMFVPFGFFVPLLWRVPDRTAAAVGSGASLLIEVVQLWLPRTTDVDDWLLNTAGTLLGIWLYHRLQSRSGNRLDRFRTERKE